MASQYPVDLYGYIKQAKERLGLKSNRALERETGLKLGQYTGRRKSLPSEDSMITLANAAGVPEEIALMHLHLWDAQYCESQSRIKTWTKALTSFGVTLCFLVALLHGYKGQISTLYAQPEPDTLYIMRHYWLFALGFCSGVTLTLFRNKLLNFFKKTLSGLRLRAFG